MRIQCELTMYFDVSICISYSKGIAVGHTTSRTLTALWYKVDCSYQYYNSAISVLYPCYIRAISMLYLCYILYFDGVLMVLQVKVSGCVFRTGLWVWRREKKKPVLWTGFFQKIKFCIIWIVEGIQRWFLWRIRWSVRLFCVYPVSGIRFPFLPRWVLCFWHRLNRCTVFLP